MVEHDDAPEKNRDRLNAREKVHPVKARSATGSPTSNANSRAWNGSAWRRSAGRKGLLLAIPICGYRVDDVPSLVACVAVAASIGILPTLFPQVVSPYG